MVVALAVVQRPEAGEPLHGKHGQRHDAHCNSGEHASRNHLATSLQQKPGQGQAANIEKGDDQQGAVAYAHPGFAEQPAQGAHDQQGAKVEGHMGQLETGASRWLALEKLEQGLVLAGVQNACAYSAGQVLGIEAFRHGVS
ncbi:hypothetical protein D3C77_196180 [compost metagenome]